MTFWPKFCLAVLATWRVAHLLAYEDGPFDVLARIRHRLGSGWVGTLIDCFRCLSVWIAAPAAFFVGGTAIEMVFVWLAVSGAACILEQPDRKPPVWIQPVSDANERSVEDGMLRR